MERIYRMKKRKNLTVLIDTREQNPYFFGHSKDDPEYKGVLFESASLKTGDYSIHGMSTPGAGPSITIERKNPADLFQSMGNDRARFEKEWIRMARFDYAALVIELDYYSIYAAPPDLSQMRPKSVFRSIIAISQRWGIHCFPCRDRGMAEKTTLIILKRFWEDRKPGGKFDLTNI